MFLFVLFLVNLSSQLLGFFSNVDSPSAASASVITSAAKVLVSVLFIFILAYCCCVHQFSMHHFLFSIFINCLTAESLLRCIVVGEWFNRVVYLKKQKQRIKVNYFDFCIFNSWDAHQCLDWSIKTRAVWNWKTAIQWKLIKKLAITETWKHKSDQFNSR